MSVGKLVPKGKNTIKDLVRGKEDAPIFLHITSSEQVVNLFEDKPPGYCILRLDPVFIEKWSRSPLLLTYKFGALLFTQILRVPHLRVKAAKKEILLCQCDKNSYSHIRSTAEFLPKLQSFIAEFVSNKNFVEKPLDSYSPDLKNELYYKKYLIFPANGTRLVLKKKKEDEVETAEAGIVFSNLSFFGKKGEDIKSISTFNEFLLEFLGMEEATEPQMKALGVSIQPSSRPAILSESSGANPSRLHIPSPRLLPMHGKAGKKGQFDVLAFTGKEKSAVIDRLKKAGEQTVDIADSGSSSTRSQRKYTDPREGLNTFLKELFDAVKVGQLANEKMDWIRRGLFDALVASGLIAEYTSDLQLDVPATSLSPPQKRDMLVGKILRHLLSNNPEGCREFVKLMGELLKKAREEETSEFPWGECVGLFTLLSVLIRSTEIEPFPTIFVQELGVNRMLEVYNDATNRIEADSAAEAEFQKALFKRMEEGAHRTAGGHGTSMLGTTESGTTTLNLGTSPPASYYIPVPPPPPPPLVIKRGKIRKMKKRFKTHKKDASKKDQLGDAKEADDEKERERENKEKENRERENREREEKEREIKEREIKEKEIKEKEEAESEKSKFKGVKLNTSVEFNTPRTSVDNSSPRPVIPALSLSATATKTKDEGLASAQSRFSRRRGINDETPRTPTSGRGSFGKELGRNTSFYITPSIQLTKLAFNLGETAVAADLTALMRYKTGGGNPDEPTDLSAEARNKRRSKRLSTSLSNLHNSLAIFKPGQLKPEASSFRSTAPYKIKTMILKALAKIIALPHLYAYVRSPVNLIFTELNKALASGLLKIDQPFRALLFSVLQPVADRVEYCHRIAWQQETRSMPIQRKMDFRRGLDKFLCRVHSQLCDALSRHDLADLELYLVMLGDYLHFCPTRVMASQVIDVTMETLLHIKYLVFNMVPESLTEDLRIQHVRLIHSLVRVFQELCAQTKHEGTLVFLLQLLLGTNETILFFRSYAKRIFFSEQTVQEISSHESKETLTEYRLQVIKLFSSLVSLVSAKLKYIEARRFPTSPLHLSGSSSLGLQQPHRVSSTEVDAVKEEEDSETAWCVSLMEQLGFLISPQTGYFMRFLGQGNHFSNFEVKKVMLQLFGQILMTPCNPFACNKAYTEFFISHHYLTFLKLYNSDGFDSSTLTLCALHLQILLCFAEHKTEKIKRKFYQLRIMDFLARQISLEYEIILKNAQYIESHARSPEPAAAMTQSSPNLGMADLRAQGVAQMQQSSSLPMLPLPRKTTGEVAQSSLATASTTIDPKRVTSTPALSPRKEPLKKAAKRKARAQSMSFTDSPLKLSLMSVTGVQPEDGSKRAELVSSSRAVMSQNRDTEPIIVSDRAQPKEDKKRNRMSGSFIRTSHRRIPSQNSGEQKSDWGMRSMPSWTRAKDSTVTPAAAAQATASGLSSSVSAAAGALSDANEVPEKKTFNQLKSSINMGSIGKKVGKAITLPGLKLGASLNKEAFAALAKESAESAQYSASDDDEDMLKPRVSIGSIVTMIPPTLRLSDSSSSHASTGTHSGQQITLEMTSSSTFNTASDLASDASRTETDDEDEQSSDDDSHRGPRSSVSSSSMSSSSGKLVIPGLKLSGAETKDGSSATGKGNVVIMKSPTEVKKTVIAIPGLKLTGAHTKDGSSAVGKGTTLLKSPTTAATSSRSGHDRADTDDEDEHTEEGTDADGDDEGSDRSESEREPESESDDSDEVAPKPVAKLAIPGLKLTGADTKDGSSAVGKGTVLTVKAASSSDSSSESESEDDAPPPVVAKIAIPGLKLTGADTKDGSTAVGRGTVLLKSTANTSQNSSLEDLRSPVRVAATTTRSVATPTVAAATAADSDSDASSSDSDDDAAAMPPPAPVSKLAIPGLKLTGADTKDGSSAVGKGTILSLKAAAPSISHDEPAPAAEGNTTSSDESESESDDGGEESKPQATAKFAIPGLKLTGADTKDGSSAVGKGTVLTVRTTMPSAGRGDSTSSDESESDEESRVTAKIAIPGLKLTGADTKDGSSAMGKGKVILKVGSLENFDTAFSDSSSDDSDSEAESEKPFKSPLPKMTAKLAIPGLKLTGADTKDGSSAVGKGTTLVVSTSAVSTTSVGASTQQRPVSPLAKEQQQQHSSSDSDSDDEAHTEATATDLSDSERSDRDESPRPSPSMRRSPLAIPGLKLTGSETKDGTSCVGKGTNLSRSAEFDVDQQRAPTEDHVKSVSPRSSVPGSPSRASPRLSPGSPTARPAIPSLKFPSTSAEAMPGMPGSPTRSGSGSSKEGKEGRKLIEIQERRRITPRTPKKPIMSTHPQTPKRPTGGSDGALPSPKPKVTFGGSDSGGGSDHGATSTSPRAAISLSPLSPNRSAALTIPSGAGGLEKSNSASFIPKLRFTEDLRQHNFKQEEFLKEALGEKPQKFPQLVVPAGGKTLSDIEHRILQSDPSLRFVKQSTNRRILEDIENLTGMLEDMEELSPEDIIERNQLYLSERNERKIYMDKALHITFLQLIFSLLLSPMGTLQPLYTDQFPVNNKKLNIPFLLHSHINHPANGPIIPELVERSLEMKEGAYRMLKLLTNRLFSPEQYQHMKRIAIGAYGTVYKCTVGSENLNVAVKLMELPKSIWDRCVLHDIFTEILVLDAYKDDKRICKLYDYGVSEEHYWVIMRFYRCSLKEWRLRQTRPFAENLMLYLNIFSRVLETMKICIKGDKFKINHFDLKCDNVLIDPIDPNIEEEELLNARGDKPPFNVCLADFGESTVYQSEDDGYTTRSRGTEFNKSPEMLNAAYANKKDDLQKYDRRKKTGCNKASDVWALGCLLYELLTGEFLFYDNDWVRFFIRVTYLGQELITAEKRAKIDNNPHLLRFFQWIFMRNPLMRPTLEDVIVKFQEMLNVMMPQLQENARLSLQLSPTSSVSSTSSAVDPRASMSMSGPMIFNNNNEEFLYSPTSRYHRHTLAHSLKTGDQRPGQATETDHYHEIMNKLTPYIFLGNESTHELNQLKFHYNITHIINCSEVANAHPQQFEYIQIASLKDIKLMEVIQFIHAAMDEQGKVLVSYHGRNSELAVGIVLAYLIEQHNLTYFEAFNLVKNRRYIIKPNPQLVAKVRASMTSTVKLPEPTNITADGTPELYIWDDKRKKDRKKKDKAKEKRGGDAIKDNPGNSADEVEHTAFNPLVFNRQIQERIRRNKEAGLDPLHVPVRRESKSKRSKPRLRRSSSADDVTAVPAKDVATLIAQELHNQSPGRKVSKEL